jgi:hypothetical protein
MVGLLRIVSAILVDALNFLSPTLIVAGGTGRKRSLGHLQHDGPHHLIVFVEEDVAVVDKAGVLAELVSRDVEVSALGGIHFLIEIGLGPPNTVLQGLVALNEGSVFPLGVEDLLRRLTIACDVLVVSCIIQSKEIQTTGFIYR